jgi:hypothetical protein
MNNKIYSNINNYLIIYTPKVIPWGQTEKQTNKRTHGQIFTQYSGISSHSMGAHILATKCRMDIDESGYWKPICQEYAPTYLYTTGGGGLYIGYVHVQKNAK